MKKLIFIGLLLLVASLARAQNSKEPGNPSVLPQAEENIHQKDGWTHHRVKPFKWKRQKVTHTAQYEYYKRVESAARAKQKLLRKLHKPQYSNFAYFGHKRKPKKHSADKLRYCAECGLRH